MSVSTIFMRKRPSFKPNSNCLSNKFYETLTPLTSILLWTISGLYSASKTNISYNASGITLSFPIPDLLLILASTILLLRGIEENSVVLMVPWILLTTGSIYFNHLKGIFGIQLLFKQLKKLPWIPWVALSVNVLLLTIRIMLVVRVLQLGAQIWFKNKMEYMKTTKSHF